MMPVEMNTMARMVAEIIIIFRFTSELSAKGPPLA
jgi:hypothetical protein